MNRIRTLAITVSLILYGASLTQDVVTYIDIVEGEEKLSSLLALFLGSISILGGGLFEWLIWLANPLYFLGIILFAIEDNRDKLVLLCSSAIAQSIMFWEAILVSESGRESTIIKFESGYYLWIGSILLMTATSFIFYKINENTAYKKDIKGKFG